MALPGLRHVLVDANAILRYLRHDVPAQAEAFHARVEQAIAGRLVLEIHPLVFAEVVFVLESFYEVPRARIVAVLKTFLDTPGIKLHEESRMRETLLRYGNKNVSFVDAYLAALGAETSYEIFSFDKGLDKFTDIRRIER
jgi:predicted nucleic acid-binding protein